MRRLLLLLGVALLATQASAQERVWRLGVLTPFDWPADTTMHSVMIPELARRGFVEGKNLVVLPRWGSGGDLDHLSRLAQDLALAKPDVIVAVSPNAILAAMKASPQTPIVASFTSDPVVEGVAQSLARPGGKVTGIAMLAYQGDKKRLELFHDAVPTAHKLALLTRAGGVVAQRDDVLRTAKGMGVEVVSYEASGLDDYASVFDAMRNAGVDGVVVGSTPIFHRDAAQLAALATERHLPTICEWREMASAGCLIGYGPDIAELRLRTADFIVRLFSGGNPAEMPFEQPIRFEMAINNKVARTIGVTVSPSVFVRADEVIE
jgi:putative tryptophan/tyrosine transport system substrate-binding protein